MARGVTVRGKVALGGSSTDRSTASWNKSKLLYICKGSREVELCGLLTPSRMGDNGPLARAVLALAQDAKDAWNPPGTKRRITMVVPLPPDLPDGGLRVTSGRLDTYIRKAER
ncbi:MAG: hypothetical protein ACE5LS_00010 [Thermoplasmata archaeon]